MVKSGKILKVAGALAVITLTSGCATNSDNRDACFIGLNAVGIGLGVSGGGGAVMGGAAVGTAIALAVCPGIEEAEAQPVPVATSAFIAEEPPVDSDGDGVFDDTDQCPNTPRGIVVDEVGCPVPIVLSSDDLNFAFDSAKLGDGAPEVLEPVLKFASDYPEKALRIEGHTDSKGSDGYNYRLSRERAEAVRAYLIEKGVHPSRLVAIGLGEGQPVATNDTDEGRALNRRVEVTIAN